MRFQNPNPAVFSQGIQYFCWQYSTDSMSEKEKHQYLTVTIWTLEFTESQKLSCLHLKLMIVLCVSFMSLYLSNTSVLIVNINSYNLWKWSLYIMTRDKLLVSYQLLLSKIIGTCIYVCLIVCIWYIYRQTKNTKSCNL